MVPIQPSDYVLKIDAYAYSTALTLARLAGRQECMFLLLGEAGANVVRHILLLPDQQVTPCSCHVSALSMSAAISEIDRLNDAREPKWVVLGWGHSHGELDVFHSATDIDTSAEITAQIGFANRMTLEVPLSVRLNDAGELCVSLSPAEGDMVLQSCGPAIRNVQAVRRITSGFSYSLVVNACGDTYAEVITQPLNAPAPGTRHAACLQVLPAPLDEEPLRQEIERKLCSVRAVEQPVALLPAPVKEGLALRVMGLCLATWRRWR